MSLSKQELDQHCHKIIGSPRVRNKIVILCEGSISSIKGRESPSAYRQMEKMPDSNFYKACIPRKWRQHRPQFFNCGDRKDVIDTYYNLLSIDDSNDSFLNTTKLFAIIDLDIQTYQFENYTFSDSEELFHNIYNNMFLDEVKAKEHHIWITGLIHKEAYFLLPIIQKEVYNDYDFPLHYDNKPLNLDDIYLSMVDSIDKDSELNTYFTRICKRIQFCNGLDCSNINNLKKSWDEQLKSTHDDAKKEKLIFALLMIKKAKKYWHNIKNENWTGDELNFKDQLSLEIGRFYSNVNPEPNLHIPTFFKVLHKFA